MFPTGRKPGTCWSPAGSGLFIQQGGRHAEINAGEQILKPVFICCQSQAHCRKPGKPHRSGVQLRQYPANLHPIHPHRLWSSGTLHVQKRIGAERDRHFGHIGLRIPVFAGLAKWRFVFPLSLTVAFSYLNQGTEVLPCCLQPRNGPLWDYRFATQKPPCR